MSTSAVVDKKSHVVLVDGSGYIFRAYHALPPLTRKTDGLPIGAVAGFSNMLFKLLQGQNNDSRPTHFAVIFDASSQTFRNDIYDQYKANRSETPEDLIPQFPLVRDATRAFGSPSIEFLVCQALGLKQQRSYLSNMEPSKTCWIMPKRFLKRVVEKS